MRKSSSSMNVQQFPRVFWDYVQPAVHESSSSSTFAPASVCKRSLRSIAPKMADNDNINNNESFPVLGSYDLKSFIRSESGPRRLSPASYSNSEDINICTKGDKNVQVATHPGGTRWNPTQEQICILEMLYKGGMRTPNANQIEQIAEKLAKFGKIEGKNVFYWFQNHKARERQKQKRERLATHNSYHPTSLSHPSSTELATARITITSLLNSDIVTKEDYHVVGVSEGAQKRRCRSWNSVEKEPYEKECNDAIRIRNWQCRSDDEASACRTLQLFPLHPEGKG